MGFRQEEKQASLGSWDTDQKFLYLSHSPEYGERKNIEEEMWTSRKKVKAEEFRGFVRSLESLMNEEEFQKLGEKMKKHSQWLKEMLIKHIQETVRKAWNSYQTVFSQRKNFLFPSFLPSTRREGSFHAGISMLILWIPWWDLGGWSLSHAERWRHPESIHCPAFLQEHFRDSQKFN